MLLAKLGKPTFLTSEARAACEQLCTLPGCRALGEVLHVEKGSLFLGGLYKETYLLPLALFVHETLLITFHAENLEP